MDILGVHMLGPGFKNLSEKIQLEHLASSRHRFNSYVAFWYISRRKGACFYNRIFFSSQMYT